MSGMGPGIMSAVNASSKKQKEEAVLEQRIERIKRTKSDPLEREGKKVITGHEPGIPSTRGGRKRKTKRRKRKSRKKRRRKKTKKRRRKKRTKRRK